MNTNDLIKHFGGASQAQAALDISRQLWWVWTQTGVPSGRQAQIQILTGGALQAQLPVRRRRA